MIEFKRRILNYHGILPKVKMGKIIIYRIFNNEEKFVWKEKKTRMIRVHTRSEKSERRKKKMKREKMKKLEL